MTTRLEADQHHARRRPAVSVLPDTRRLRPGVVPRFYFHVVANGRTSRNDDGMDLMSLEHASLETARAAAEMLGSAPETGRNPPMSRWQR